MAILLPGFPATNPILLGLSAVEAGLDIEDVLIQRDLLLSTPSLFINATWEAFFWISPSVPAIAQALITQSSLPWLSLPVAERQVYIAKWYHQSLNEYQSSALISWMEKAPL